MSRRVNDVLDYNDYIDVTKKEFNQMGIYLLRTNNIADRRDIAFETGELLNFYRSTRSLLSNVKSKLLSEKIDTITDVEQKLKALGIKIRSVYLAEINDKIRQKNLLLLEEELLDLNTELNNKIMASGMIFPKKEFKTVTELREDDY